MGKLDGKVSIVSGAGSSGPGVGTGKAISVTLAREGASVLLVDKFRDRAEDTLRLIEAEGHTATVFEGDITKPDDIQALVGKAIELFGGIDILVNNAAVVKHAPITEVSAELYDSIVAVNLTGAFLACQATIPHLVARGGGSIVNIGSTSSMRDTGASSPAYSATKAALLGLTVDLAGAYGPDNVRVNAVVPGMIAGPMAKSFQDAQSQPFSLRGMNLLGRAGDAWDVAKAVAFLCSDDAAYITGIALPVDGGSMAAMPASYRLRAGS